LTSTRRNELWKAWIAAILWLIVIAIESTPWLSAHNTSRILYPLFHFLFGMDLFRFAILHVYIRKSGHVVGYGILSLLAFRAWRETLPAQGNPFWTLRWSTIAVLMTAIVASLDEWHQSFIPTRTGRWQDAALDTCSGIAVQGILFFWFKWRQAREARP
jgi:VanZ family protein